MSLNFKIGLDTQPIKNEVFNVKKMVAGVDAELEKTKVKAMTYWSYINQITSMAMSMLANVAETEAEQQTIRTLQFAQQTIMGEISFLQIGFQAAAAYASGNIAQGVMLSMLAAGMQATIVRNIAAEVESRRIQASMEQIKAELEAYSS